MHYPALLASFVMVGFVALGEFWLSSASLEVAAVGGLSVSNALKRQRGRPRKFDTPSRAITLTLPESVLSTLSTIHADISQAIVRLALRAQAGEPKPLAELSVFGRQAVITVRPTRSLERRAGVQLIPLPDGRALISFEQPRSISDLELTLHDALEDNSLPADDRSLFQEIVKILKDARRSGRVALHRRSIIVLKSAGRTNGSNPGRSVRRRRT